MVMGVLNKAFDVLILSLGVVKRIYCEVSEKTYYWCNMLVVIICEEYRQMVHVETYESVPQFACHT